MPRRTNLFQDVVGIIQRHVAGSASVEESGMVPNRLTNRKREVDVVVRGKLGAHDVVVGIEAHDTSRSARKASVEWVERMLGKHRNLGTNKLVLVSEIGFSEQALDLAKKEYVATLTPQDLTTDDPVGVVVNRLDSLWQKNLELRPYALDVYVRDETGSERPMEMTAEDRFVYSDGEILGTAHEVTTMLLGHNRRKIPDGVGFESALPSVATQYTIEVGPPWIVRRHEVEEHMFVKQGAADTLHHVHRLLIFCEVDISEHQIPLRHRRLGDVAFSQGETTLFESHALIVMTENETGGKTTVRVRKPNETQKRRPKKAPKPKKASKGPA